MEIQQELKDSVIFSGTPKLRKSPFLGLSDSDLMKQVRSSRKTRSTSNFHRQSSNLSPFTVHQRDNYDNCGDGGNVGGVSTNYHDSPFTLERI